MNDLTIHTKESEQKTISGEAIQSQYHGGLFTVVRMEFENIQIIIHGLTTEDMDKLGSQLKKVAKKVRNDLATLEQGATLP